MRRRDLILVIFMAFILVLSSCAGPAKPEKSETLDPTESQAGSAETTAPTNKETAEGKDAAKSTEKTDTTSEEKTDEKTEAATDTAPATDTTEEITEDSADNRPPKEHWAQLLEPFTGDGTEIVWILDGMFVHYLESWHALAFLGKKSDQDDGLYEGNLYYIAEDKAKKLEVPNDFPFILYKDISKNRLVSFHDGIVAALDNYRPSELIDAIIKLGEEAVLSKASDMGRLVKLRGHGAIVVKRHDAEINQGIDMGGTFKPIFIRYYGDEIVQLEGRKIDKEEFESFKGGAEAIKKIKSGFEKGGKVVEIGDIFFRESAVHSSDDKAVISVNFTVTAEGRDPKTDTENYFANYAFNSEFTVELMDHSEICSNPGQGKYLEYDALIPRDESQE